MYLVCFFLHVLLDIQIDLFLIFNNLRKAPLRFDTRDCGNEKSGSSENITVSAGRVLGVAYGGNTATAANPAGTKASVDTGAPIGVAINEYEMIQFKVILSKYWVFYD